MMLTGDEVTYYALLSTPKQGAAALSQTVDFVQRVLLAQGNLNFFSS